MCSFSCAAAVAVAALSMSLAVGGTKAFAKSKPEPQVPRDASAHASKPAQPVISPPGRKPIARPLPPAGDLERVLREVAQDAIRLARENPKPGSWMLAKVAQAQAEAGDRAGASITFDAAIQEAVGDRAKPPNVEGLRWIGQAQATVGMNAEARATLARAGVALPEAGDFMTDFLAVSNMKILIQSQARAGDRHHARENLKRLEEFVAAVLKTSRIGNADAAALPELACAQAAVADFDGAFATVERLRRGGPEHGLEVGHALSQIARGTEYLKPLELQRFVRRLDEEVKQLKDPS